MQSEVALTYNSSGVDIDENQKANRMLSEIVGKTLSEGVVSQPGFFSGAIRLNSLLRGNQNHLVCDSLSEQSFESFDLDSVKNYVKDYRPINRLINWHEVRLEGK